MKGVKPKPEKAPGKTSSGELVAAISQEVKLSPTLAAASPPAPEEEGVGHIKERAFSVIPLFTLSVSFCYFTDDDNDNDNDNDNENGNENDNDNDNDSDSDSNNDNHTDNNNNTNDNDNDLPMAQSQIDGR